MAPFEQAWLIWFAFVPLLLALEDAAGWSGFLLALGSGLTLFTALSYGLLAYYPSAFVLLVLGLAALYAGVFSARRTLAAVSPPWLRPFLLPALWVLAEIGATSVDAPWSAALTQVRHPLWVQSASLFGAHVVSFEILLANAALLEVCAAVRRGGPAALRDGRLAAPAAIAASIVAGAAAFGAWSLARPDVSGRRVALASIQPVVLPDVYAYQGLEPRHRQALSDLVEGLSAEALADHPDLLLWPEGGNGRYNFRVAASRDKLAAMARRSGASLLVSSYDLDSEGRLFNAVYSLSSGGDVVGRYAKSRLTPFGERHFTAGGESQPLATPFGPVGALICFESTFSSLARALVAQGAEALVISSSDASFLHSSLPALHAGSAVYRAVENGRAAVLASNAGPSLIVSPRGEIRAETGLFERTVLRGEIELRRERTLYTRLGDAPLALLCTAIVAAGTVFRLRRRREGDGGIAPRGARLATVSCLTAGLLAGAAMALASLALSSQRVDRFGPGLGERLEALLHPPVTAIRPDTANAYLQGSPTSCGPAALAYLMSYLGAETAERDLMPLVHLTAAGTSLADLAAAARARGFSAWGERQNWAALRQMPKPLIAHVGTDHYLVVLSTGDDAVDVFDPAAGYRRLGRESFLREWQGNVLIVRFRDDAAAEGGAGGDPEVVARPGGGRP